MTEAKRKPPTANLQSPADRVTIKQAAKEFQVSERMVYMARELMATGQSDLIAKVDSGALTLHGALKLALPQKYGSGRNYRPGDDHYDALIRAWNACDEREQSRFIFKIIDRLKREEEAAPEAT